MTSTMDTQRKAQRKANVKVALKAEREIPVEELRRNGPHIVYDSFEETRPKSIFGLEVRLSWNNQRIYDKGLTRLVGFNDSFGGTQWLVPVNALFAESNEHLKGNATNH